VKYTALLSLFLVATPVLADEARLPLPDGPVVALIQDPRAFDRALTGGFRRAASGTLPASDPAGAAWKRTRVGGKLVAQWEMLAKDLPLTWPQLMALQPTSVGLTLLAAGDLEAVLALRTGAAPLALAIPGGAEKSHKGMAYRLVSRGAGDDHTADRRMGLAWARVKGCVLIATSERALVAALDKCLANDGATPALPGIVSMRLDLDALRKDLYFRREFLFDEGQKGPESGILEAALRVDGNDLVEVREGSGETRPPAAGWTTAGRDVAAAGWESDGARFFPALRRGLLEPLPSPSSRPVAALAAFPALDPGPSDRYRTDLTKPAPVEGPWGEGELPRWAEAIRPLGGWGWEIGRAGARRLVVKATPGDEKAMRALALETARRRAGASAMASGTASDEVRVGPDLATLAFRRTGDWLWIAGSSADLADVVEPKVDAALVRWGTLDLSQMRQLGRAWAAAEGAFSPGETRPFSDRVLGLLGWMPRTTALSTERRRDGDRFTERIVLRGEAAPPEKPAPRPAAPKPAAKAAPKKPKA